MNFLTHPLMATVAQTVQKVSTPLDPNAEGTWWFPVQGSTLAPETDWAFYYVFWISLFFTALIVGVMIFFMIRYRHRKGVWDGEPTANHSLLLELTWSIIPFLLTIVMWWEGLDTFMFATVVPTNSMEIQVKARQWNWEFIYPDGTVSTELHVPADEPVTFVMTSPDVIHSFWVPAWRVKKDIVPGRYNKTWVEATEPGDYMLMCTEYCGLDHSEMLAPVVVHRAEGSEPMSNSDSAANITFEEWYAAASIEFFAKYEGKTSVQIGEMVYNQYCITCHTIDGSANAGPSWKGIFGTTEQLEDGSVVVDENYIRESILDPGAKIVKGFPPTMSTYRGTVTDEEIDGIIAYIKELAN